MIIIYDLLYALLNLWIVQHILYIIVKCVCDVFLYYNRKYKNNKR